MTEESLEKIKEAIEDMPVSIIPADKKLTELAAFFKAKYAVSYVDCFAAALARQFNGILLTGDKEFNKLEKEIKIEWID